MSPPPGNKPLYLIDGRPATTEQFASLNPENIQKIEVLSAKQGTALYSSQALNGAVLITSRPRRKQQAALFKQRQQQPTQQLPNAALTK
ncbi:TonB-dependent receptor plug domain-containing protein [Hymenobacter jeollabukensis]|nr:TonB-dependent receptor plug domain-containing protein [Hymenobacter jeollabukensis]